MSSFRSHNVESEAHSSKSSRRIPTKSSTTDSGSKHRNAAQQVSRLAKRASRSIIPAPTRPQPSDKSTKASQAPVPTPDHGYVPSRRISLTKVSSKIPAPSIVHKLSPVSGSSTSFFDSHGPIHLQRKPLEAVDTWTAQKRSENGSSQDGLIREEGDDSVRGIPREPSQSSELLNEIHKCWTPSYAPSTTPSTRFTDSPFSHAPTPSSASHSPSLFTSIGASRSRYPASPIIRKPSLSGPGPSVNDDSPLRLPRVRESSTSSSTSTVRPTGHVRTPPAQNKLVHPQISVPKTEANTMGQHSTGVKLTKQRLRPFSSKRLVQAPPELAHLNVDPVTKPATDKTPPPVRPSRHGTSNISDMNRPSMVIQSDLPRPYKIDHRRTPPQRAPLASRSPSPSFKSLFRFPSRSSSRNEFQSINSVTTPPSPAHRHNSSITGEFGSLDAVPQLREAQHGTGKDPSPAKSPRAGFLRKLKAGQQPVEKPRRSSRPGPAAGTGHEGYARFGFRGRRSSLTSSSGIRSPSTDTTTSATSRTSIVCSGSKDEVELDDFLRDRLNPLVLRGQGSNTRSTYGNASSSSNPSGTLPNLASPSSSSIGYPHPHHLSSAMGSSEYDTPGEDPRKLQYNASESAGDDAGARDRTRTSQARSGSPMRGSASFDTSLPQKAFVAGHEPESSAGSTLLYSEATHHVHDRHWLRLPSPEFQPKLSRKRNFSERVTVAPQPAAKNRAMNSTPSIESLTDNSFGDAVAHYALSDSSDRMGLDELERMLRENETSYDGSMSDFDEAPNLSYEDIYIKPLSPRHRKYGSESDFISRLLSPQTMAERQSSTETPDPLSGRPTFASHATNVNEIHRSRDGSPSARHAISQERSADLVTNASIPQWLQGPVGTFEQEHTSVRRPRLAPVGRIPVVVARRDRDRKPPEQSFSRPFVQNQPRPVVKPPGLLYQNFREMASPSESNSQPMSSASSALTKSSTSTSAPGNMTILTSPDTSAYQDFNSSRKTSEHSYVSSSSGERSGMASFFTTAPVQQEDIWTEYNDFMDEVVPMKRPKTPTTGSSLGAPFQYASMFYDRNVATCHVPLLTGPPPTAQLPLPPGTSLGMSLPSLSQQVRRHLYPSLSPITTDTASTLTCAYANRNSSTLFDPDEENSVAQCASLQHLEILDARGSIASSRDSRVPGRSRSISLSDDIALSSQANATQPCLNRHAIGNIARLSDDSAKPSVSLRRGALMTSKWLSSGRGLFSPAHNVAQLVEEVRILIIDSLSSDWSFYVATQYPKAKVYNMQVSGGDPQVATWPTVDGSAPNNHCQIPVAGIPASFPWPKGFFTAVVFRFPRAATEQAYTVCIYECKRVLRPGGYLEVAVLDLDLMNMGSKARKAVRDLKIRMQRQDGELCLQNLSDILVRLIGRRGFENVQRCVLNVPTAGRIGNQSLDISSTPSSERTAHGRDAGSCASNDAEISDLLNEARSSAFDSSQSSDESITKMVAKTGRWWYSACYESSVPQAHKSIWSDPSLLRECEKQGTCFRLLICHAQKPTYPRRRTVSV